MNIKMNTVSIIVLASLSAGMANSYAGFNETPYVSYLSGGDYDAAFSTQRQVDAPTTSVSRALVLETQTSKGTVDLNRNSISLAAIVAHNITTKPITKAIVSSEAMPVEAANSPSCPAEEIGYIAPCL